MLFGILTMAAAVLAACGGSSGDSTPTPEASSPGGAATASSDNATSEPARTTAAASTPDIAARAACAVAKPHAVGDSNETLPSGGLERTYILHVPPQYDGTRETPLVLNLHGFGSNARQQAIYSGFPAKGDHEGFIVVTPNGTGAPQHWNYPGLPGTDDIAFIRELLDRLESDLCIDAKRVFVSGMSNGAAMSSFVACAMPDRITAIAPVAASVFARTCPGVGAIPIISFRGTDDFCVPFEGGTSQCGQQFPVVAAKDAMKSWAEHDGCSMTPAEQQFSANVDTIAYSECADDTAVVLFIIKGGGHTWPGAIDVPRLGATTHEVNATDEIWQFFVGQGNLRR